MEDILTYKEMIVQSDSAKRMISTVSPIYENAYVGCWLFEDIGREWDRLWDIITSFPDQLFPQSVTWLIEQWERRYGITPNIGDSIETRRQRLIEAEAPPKPFTPWSIERYTMAVCGRKALVEERIAPYTFRVNIISEPNSAPIDYSKINRWIYQHKHSHLSYEIYLEFDDRIAISVETMYWKFHPTLSGEKPYRNYPGGLDRDRIYIDSHGQGYSFRYPFSGESETGILPNPNITSGVQRSQLTTDSSGAGYHHGYILCGVTNSGGGVL